MIAVVVGSLLVAAGCGDGDDGAPEAAETSTSVPAAAASAAQSTSSAPSTTATPVLTASAQISTGGLGVVRIGAAPDAAAEAAGTTLVRQGEPVGANDCHYVVPSPGPDGVRFMVAGGNIARIDVDRGGIQTLSGAGIGSTRDEIVDLFGDKIQPEPHPGDPDGELLVFVPVDAADADRRVVFETDVSGTVVRYRTGRLPEVLYADGCTDAA